MSLTKLAVSLERIHCEMFSQLFRQRVQTQLRLSDFHHRADSISVVDSITGTTHHIQFRRISEVNRDKTHWLLGHRSDEIVFFGEELAPVEDSDVYLDACNIVSRYEADNNAYDNLLLQEVIQCAYPNCRVQAINRYTYDTERRGVFPQSGFYYPATLFRRSHADYFKDLNKPTPGEFLTAIMMEGQYARDEKEAAAIKEAKVLFEREGH